MSRRRVSADPGKRHLTRTRGISYRVRKDGTKQYSVYFRRQYIPVEGGEEEARAKQADLRLKAARGEKAVVPTKASFADVSAQWFESKRHLRAWTRKNYRASLDNELLPRFGTKKIRAIDADDVARLIRDLERKGLKPSTIDNHLKPLGGTMAFALRRGLIAQNPCRLLTRDDRPAPRERRQHHVWSDAEMKALIEAAEYRDRQPESRYGEYTPLLRTALATGLRLGELLGLQWQDIDLQAGELHVRRQWARSNEYAKPKTKAGERDIPLSPDFVTYLAEFKRRQFGDVIPHDVATRPVFASRSGQPLSHRNAQRRGFEPAAKKAGIKNVTFHSLRGAFASRMISKGIDPVTLAGLLGHEDARVTLARYAREYDRQRRDDVVREAMAW